MKRSVVLALWALVFFSASAQTTEEGIRAIDYENYATAKRIFMQLTRLQPTEAKNFYYLGITYNLLSKADSARIAYNAGSQADPKFINNWIGLGRTYLDQSNAAKANEYFDKAKSLTSQKDVNLYILLADAYTNSSHPDCQQSLNLLTKAIEYTNKNADVYWELGNADECLNKGGDAVSAYERAAELNPAMAKALTRVGVIWRLARNYNQSLTSFQKAIAADPKFPPAYREMAELYFYTGQFDKAKETYQKYLDMADKDDYTQFRYAQYLFLTKDYQGAMTILNGLKSKIDDPIIYRLLAYSSYELGNYPEGLDYMNTFFSKIDSSKLLSSDYEYYGKLLSKTGQDSLAVINYEKAIAQDSTKFTLYNDLGALRFQEKRYHEAAEAYRRKVEASEKEATLQDYFNEGKSYYFSKEFLQSDSAFAQMTVLNKQWPIGYFWRARVMTNLDNPDSAKGLAAPYYQAVIEKAMVDTGKYKKELMEAYKYLGDINALKENYGASLYYYGKYMALEPTNTEVPKTMESVKSLYKNAATSTVPLQKNAEGSYIIPATINAAPVDLVFNASQIGIAVKQETASKLMGKADGGTMLTVDKITIAGRNVKTFVVHIDDTLTSPAEIGADALNSFNIVFDYATGSLLLR
jgi:tetratricopeptide (TPR) repeat protein